MILLLLGCPAPLCGSYERSAQLDTTCPCVAYAQAVDTYPVVACRPDQTGSLQWPPAASVAQGGGTLSDTWATGSKPVLFCTCEALR